MHSAVLLRGLILAGLLLSILTSAGTTLDPHRGLLDFGSFVMAGESSRAGLDPYGVHPDLPASLGLDMGHAAGRTYSPNLNPPISLYLFRPLAGVDAVQARNLVNLASVLILTAAGLALLRRYPEQRRGVVIVWLASLAGFWHLLYIGQIYAPLIAAGVGAWLLIEKRQGGIWAGILIGLVVCLKPNFAIWPLLLLLAGDRRQALVACATAAVISAVPFVLDGPSIYAQWLAAARDYPYTGLPINASLIGAAERLGLAPLGYAVAGGLVVAAGLLVWRLQPSARDASALGIVIALLVGPLTWTGYTLFLAPVLLARRWRGWELAVAASLSFPVWLTTLLEARAGWLPWSEITGGGLVILLGLLVRDMVASRAGQRTPRPDEAVDGAIAARAA